jgi:acyl-CoA synthetase (AMP-forming)/AMP-acid ligase II
MVHMGGMDAALLESVMTNLNSVPQRAAADHGERPAVRMDGLVLSYSQLRDAAGRMTSLLASAGIVPGDNVYPREVEEVLYEHPAVAEVAVMVSRMPSSARSVPP